MGDIFCCSKDIHKNDNEIKMSSGTEKNCSLHDSRRRKIEEEKRKQQYKLEQDKIIKQQMNESYEDCIINDNKFNEIVGDTVDPTHYLNNNNNVDQNNINNNNNFNNDNIDNQNSNNVNPNIEFVKNLI